VPSALTGFLAARHQIEFNFATTLDRVSTTDYFLKAWANFLMHLSLIAASVYRK
jgi:hypothetical protein